MNMVVDLGLHLLMEEHHLGLLIPVDQAHIGVTQLTNPHTVMTVVILRRSNVKHNISKR